MKKYIKSLLFVAMFSTFSLSAFGEEAPVYDVDNYPPQFDGQPDMQMVPPPPPQVQAAPQKVSRNNVDDDQPYTQSLSLEQRVGKLEQQISNALHNENPTKVDDMQTEMQTLRGQLEELTHQLQQLQTQQKSLYADLDKRLSAPAPATQTATADTEATDPLATPSEKPAAKAKTSKAKATAKAADTTTVAAKSNEADGQPNPAEEQQIYQTAYSFIKAKKYSQAASTLQKMLQKYPSGQFAANAHYWLGELYGLMGKNDQAATEFNNVVKNYPESPKLADAQLKLGLIYAAEFKWADARSAFKTVMSNYPGTSSARLASEQLKQIKQTGH